MKKVYLILIAITLIAIDAKAQIVTHSTGKIEIPNLTQNDGPLNWGSLLWFSSGSPNTAIQENFGLNLVGAPTEPVKVYNASLLVGYPSNGESYGQNNLLVNGNAGIGTTSPEARLHVFAPLDGSVSPLTIGNGNDPGNTNVPFGSPTGGYNIDFKSWRDVAPDQVCARIRAERINNFQPNNALIQAMDLAFYTSYGVDQSQLTEKMRVKFNGNVGIGTSNPDQKLTVNGTIHSSAVVVDTAIPVPDYVFQSSYKLIDLPSLGEYLQKYHHLPEIPSATQIKKEGLNLGEMNTLLLKKVEELTLYLIEKDKEMQSEKDARQKQQQEIDELKEKLNTLITTSPLNNK